MPLKYSNKFKAKAKAFYEKFKKNFFWNGFIRALTIMYIQSCISFCKVIKKSMTEGEEVHIFDSVTSKVAFAALILYPFICWKAIYNNSEKLEEKSVQDRIGNLYSDLITRPDHQNKNWNLSYYPIFLLRRVLFVGIPTFFFAWPWHQIQALIWSTSIYIIFYAGIKPHNSRGRSRIEIFNECMIMIGCYHLICFSEFNLSSLTQYQTGYSYVAVFAIVLLVNLGVMVFKQLSGLSHKKKLKAIRKAKLDVFVAQRKLNFNNYVKQFNIDDVKHFQDESQYVEMMAVVRDQTSFVNNPQRSVNVKEAHGQRDLRIHSSVGMKQKASNMKKLRKRSLGAPSLTPIT